MVLWLRNIKKTHTYTQMLESKTQIHIYSTQIRISIYYKRDRHMGRHVRRGNNKERLTAVEDVWMCDPGRRKWVVFLGE